MSAQQFLAMKQGRTMPTTIFGGQVQTKKSDGRRSRCRAGWTKTHKNWPGIWKHDSSGWTVRHCGHPTALWPYYGIAPGGESVGILITGGFWPNGGEQPNGYAFRTIELAMNAVEAHVGKAGAK